MTRNNENDSSSTCRMKNRKYYRNIQYHYGTSSWKRCLADIVIGTALVAFVQLQRCSMDASNGTALAFETFLLTTKTATNKKRMNGRIVNHSLPYSLGGWNQNFLKRNVQSTNTLLVRSSHFDSNIAVRDLLYKEHEDMLTKRGIYEEELMKFNYSPLLQQQLNFTGASSCVSLVSETSNNKKTTKNTNRRNNANNAVVGFGSTASSSSSNNNKKNTKKKKLSLSFVTNTKINQQNRVEDSPYYKESIEYANILERDGVVRIDNIFGTPPPPSLASIGDNSPCIETNNSSCSSKMVMKKKKDMIDELREFVTLLRMDSMNKVYNRTNDDHSCGSDSYNTIINPKLYKERFADVLLRKNRCDLKIPLIGKRSTSQSRNNRMTSNVVKTADGTSVSSNSINEISSLTLYGGGEEKDDKYNIHVDNTDIVETALYHALTKSPISDTIRNLFSRYYSGSNNEAKNNEQTQPPLSPVLYELSSLISDPGSSRQTIHPDNPIIKQQQQNSTNTNNVPVLLTCFIALQDITEDMGPTIWLPGTHTAHYHNLFFQDQPPTIAQSTNIQQQQGVDGAMMKDNESPKDHLLRTHPALMGTLKRGCCAIYDSRVLVSIYLQNL